MPVISDYSHLTDQELRAVARRMTAGDLASPVPAGETPQAFCERTQATQRDVEAWVAQMLAADQAAMGQAAQALIASGITADQITPLAQAFASASREKRQQVEQLLLGN